MKSTSEATLPLVRLGPQAAGLWGKGRPWFYADDVDDGPDEPAVVRVVDATDRTLGFGFFSPVSRIVLRRCGTWPAEVTDPDGFFRHRLQAAIDMRAVMLRDPTAGCRLVHGDGDGLPGLIVDRYADCLVLQSTSAVIENHLDCIVPVLVTATNARCVLARNDLAARDLERLPREVRLLHGEAVEQVTIFENGLRHVVDLWRGHKTGFYLDQRPARAQAMQICADLALRQGGAAVLDLFAYQGAFGLAALAGGATSVLAIDQSAPALERALRAAADHGLAGLSVRQQNVFDALRELRSSTALFDLVILDPPAFAKSRRETQGALRGYRDLNRQALRLLRPGGYLLTCSCSHHVDLNLFERLLRQAASNLPFQVLLRQRLMAGPDHAVWLNLPETEYLKSFLLQRSIA